MEDQMAPFCAQYREAMEIIGRRWTGAILRVLLTGTTRFGEICTLVPGLSDRLLSERLKELECEGLVVRTVTPNTPVLVEYHLTEKGRALEGVIHAVADWADRWIEEPAANTA
jgi:DNA-binding HxlR family transcriptional regulator